MSGLPNSGTPAMAASILWRVRPLLLDDP